MERWWHLNLKGVRVATLLAPPAGLVLLWLSPRIARREKVFGSVGIPLFTIPYVVGVVAAFHFFLGIDFYEWRGGYYPVLAWSPTRPDYDQLEASRAGHKANTNIGSEATAAADWPGFRGQNRDGHHAGKPILTRWPASGLRLRWRQPIGGGYASFAIANGVAFTIEQRREKEVVTAYDMETGRELWAHGWEAQFRESIGGDGPRATPTWHDGRLYALGGTGEFRCLDAATGQLNWRRNILRENRAGELTYGASASPLAVEDKVIVLPGGPAGKSIVAYHRLTGEPVWSVLDDTQAYVSPMLVTLAGEKQLLVVGARRTVGLAVADGKMLWEFPWCEPNLQRNVAQPVVWNGDRFFLSAGYDTICAAARVVRTADGFKAFPLWQNKNLKNKFTSSIHWNGHLYGLDEEILVCLDATTGERKWKDGRYGYGQLLLASGHLVILCGNGDLALVRATPVKHEEVARFSAIKGKTWNHPALADGKLLVRNAAEMACFDISPK